ncbi:restriction endonuclease subunit S [Corynebacterium kozikiae]|uniref:restriction endonuclease subunit S n=1 Tax=Corynebacterium kozikiae TaxID=2968469 RepID=UPI00211CCCCC|nr:restriction endonuclease subunit S [Corynebacterium sp. 76QC2CO]MCQ9343863.1 restriction endonuclease subunit S [Corynebacterium sp. 76QC2CO]
MAAFPMVPVGFATEVMLGKMVTNTPKNSNDVLQRYVHAANIRDYGILDMEHSEREMWFTKSEACALDIRAGDLLLAEGGASGKPAIALEDLENCGFQNSVLRVRKIDGLSEPRYLLYVFLSAFLEGNFARLINTVSISHLPAEKLSRFRIPLPDIETQRRIANYLDHETKQIDTLVAELDEYVELLESRKLRSVTQAVSHGIPDSETMASHPKVKLHFFSRFVSGTGFPIDEQGVTDQQYPFYKVSSLSKVAADGLTIIDKANSVSAEKARQLSATLIPPASAIVAKIGEAVRLKKVRINQYTCCIDNNMLALIPRQDSICTRFFPYALSILNIDLILNPGTVPTLNMSTLRNYGIPLPDLDTQHRIADFLDEETAKTDTIITECIELKELLLKRRQVLITDVVTGKVEV